MDGLCESLIFEVSLQELELFVKLVFITVSLIKGILFIILMVE